jgi:hypothetical protein
MHVFPNASGVHSAQMGARPKLPLNPIYRGSADFFRLDLEISVRSDIMIPVPSLSIHVHFTQI